jgi:hypothetical protein
VVEKSLFTNAEQAATASPGGPSKPGGGGGDQQGRAEQYKTDDLFITLLQSVPVGAGRQ